MDNEAPSTPEALVANELRHTGASMRTYNLEAVLKITLGAHNSLIKPEVEAAFLESEVGKKYIDFIETIHRTWQDGKEMNGVKIMWAMDDMCVVRTNPDTRPVKPPQPKE